jgi:hypothetical protein
MLGAAGNRLVPTRRNPGLWNEDFRPLRAPVPLLAVRRMLVFDLPFLVESSSHLDAWLERFAPRVLLAPGAPTAGG